MSLHLQISTIRMKTTQSLEAGESMTAKLVLQSWSLAVQGARMTNGSQLHHLRVEAGSKQAQPKQVDQLLQVSQDFGLKQGGELGGALIRAFKLDQLGEVIVVGPLLERGNPGLQVVLVADEWQNILKEY